MSGTHSSAKQATSASTASSASDTQMGVPSSTWAEAPGPEPSRRQQKQWVDYHRELRSIQDNITRCDIDIRTTQWNRDRCVALEDDDGALKWYKREQELVEYRRALMADLDDTTGPVTA